MLLLFAVMVHSTVKMPACAQQCEFLICDAILIELPEAERLEPRWLVAIVHAWSIAGWL